MSFAWHAQSIIKVIFHGKALFGSYNTICLLHCYIHWYYCSDLLLDSWMTRVAFYTQERLTMVEAIPLPPLNVKK